MEEFRGFDLVLVRVMGLVRFPFLADDFIVSEVEYDVGAEAELCWCRGGTE